MSDCTNIKNYDEFFSDKTSIIDKLNKELPVPDSIAVVLGFRQEFSSQAHGRLHPLASFSLLCDWKLFVFIRPDSAHICNSK